MAETAERSYRVIRAEDGSYAVQVTPHEANAPLTISGFKSEDEARAWIERGKGKHEQVTSQEARALGRSCQNPCS